MRRETTAIILALALAGYVETGGVTATDKAGANEAGATANHGISSVLDEYAAIKVAAREFARDEPANLGGSDSPFIEDLEGPPYFDVVDCNLEARGIEPSSAAAASLSGPSLRLASLLRKSMPRARPSSRIFQRKRILAKDVHKKWLKDPAYREAYGRLAEEFARAAPVIEARSRAGLTQEELAERMGTTAGVQ